MIVTPVDLGIAHYTIPALARLVQTAPSFSAVVYCNGLSVDEAEGMASLVGQYDRVSHVDNSVYMREIQDTIRPGDWYLTDAGRREFRQGNYESGSEVWSRELVRLDADFVTMVDADFEVFETAFAIHMLGAFAEDPRLAFFSTDSVPRRTVFETYAQEQAILAARWNTWFCIYRRSALEKFHDFTYIEEREGGLPVKYDHSAMLQEVLIREHGYSGRALGSEFSQQYLHYAAFAKNRSLRASSLWFYRLLRIAKHNGWNHRLHAPMLAKGVRGLARVAWKALRMSRFDVERQRYLFDD